MPWPEKARVGYADRVLWALAACGPCSIAELRRHLRNEGHVASAIYKHRTEGRAARLDEASYDITPDGRAYLSSLKGRAIDERNAREDRDRMPLFERD